MSDLEKKFGEVQVKWIENDPDVVEGNMMRSPGLKYKDKVFAFYHKERMGFRMGPQFDPEKFGLIDWGPLSPFKTKPPLKGWFMVGEGDARFWDELTGLALEFTKSI